MSEITIAGLDGTTFVGAFRGAEQAPAAKPEGCPSSEAFRHATRLGVSILLPLKKSAINRKKQPTHQDADRHPKMDIGENSGPQPRRLGRSVGSYSIPKDCKNEVAHFFFELRQREDLIKTKLVPGGRLTIWRRL